MLLRPPANRNRHSPLILFWHGFGSLHGEADIAEAFPLEQVEAWKAYLGLPLFGQRSVGDADLMRRQMEDYVLQLLLPVVNQAVQELPQVVEGLRSHCDLDSDSSVETLHDALKAQYQQINHSKRRSLRVFQHLKHAVDLASNSSPKQQADIVEMERDMAAWFEQYL